MNFKLQRIRDPLHNLIEFRKNEFEDTMWRVIQSRQFQRLRRIRQLGFSEMTYPGATHTRFAHSIGVFHTARMLMNVVESHLGDDYKPTQGHRAMAAALVHDLGHGPYSHAFEEVGRRLKLPMADHETVTNLLIREGEISESLNILGGGFAADVADIIGKVGPATIYRAVVSSQFDADRLDYMRRDRMMTGTQHGAIDFEWLLSNLEVGIVPRGADEKKVGDIETFVLGPKALPAAETYLLGLFQLYATVYFHKATRGAEKIFTELLTRLFELALNDSAGKTGLDERHPLIRFAKSSDDLGASLALDDSVIGGALFMMTLAEDKLIADFATRLRDRKLYKCIDVREKLRDKRRARLARESSKSARKLETAPKAKDLPAQDLNEVAELDRACNEVGNQLRKWAKQKDGEVPRILLDTVERSLYNPFDESKGPLEQIMLRPGMGSGGPVDVASISQVIKAIAPFKVFRVYLQDGDEKAKTYVERIIEKEAKK